MSSTDRSAKITWVVSTGMWLFMLATAVLLGMTFYVGIREMVKVWNIREEFSYGYLIPVITVFLIWQKKNIIEQIEFTGSWMGALIFVIGLAFFYLGSLSTITTIVQYALVISVIGLVISIMGWRATKPVLVPLLFLVFMVPLPS